MIGLLSDYIVTTPYAGQMIRGAQEAAWERDHLVLIANTEGEPEREDGLINALLARRLDGYLYASMFHRVDQMPPALAGMPIVGLDVEIGDAGPSFVPDDFAWRQGCRRDTPRRRASQDRAPCGSTIDAGHRSCVRRRSRKR